LPYWDGKSEIEMPLGASSRPKRNGYGKIPENSTMNECRAIPMESHTNP